MKGKANRFVAVLLVQLLIIVFCGCSEAKAQEGVQPLVGYQESTRLAVSNNYLSEIYDESSRFDVIDLKDQFYTLTELEVTVPDDMDQTVYLLADDMKLAGTRKLSSGDINVAIKYCHINNRF